MSTGGHRRVAIVVGASRGIGAATSEALARRGTAVLLGAPPGEDCTPVVARIKAAGGEAWTMVCDARDPAGVAGLIHAALRRHERIDALVNCAGIMGPVGRIEDGPAADWLNCQMVNLVGAYNGCRAVLPHFRRNAAGVIVNMSTGAAFHALEGWSAYCTSKAGLAMLTRILAAETQGSGIRVYSFQPGMVNTGLGQESMRLQVNRVSNFDPASFAPPTEPAAAIAWLCTEAPEDLSGQEVIVTDPALRHRVGLPPAQSPRLRPGP